MSGERPEDAAARIREDIRVLSVHLVQLSEHLQSLSATLDRHFAQPPPAAPAPAHPVAPAPAHPVTPTLAPPAPPAPPAVRHPAPTKPRRTWSVAEVFAIVGSAITLIGVALVLMMPQDGFLGPVPRTAIGLGLAAAAVGAAVWQHRADPKNVGAQALLATGVASTFLCIVALTAIFTDATGRPLLGVVPGLVAAGLVSLVGVWVASQWCSQWLAVLAVLGSLLLAPALGDDRLLGLAFMLVMTVATGFFQRDLGWAGLVLARTIPTGLTGLVVMGSLAAPGPGGGPEFVQRAVPAVVLGVALAVAGLFIALLHQSGTRAERAAATASMGLLATPLLLVGALAGQAVGTAAFLLAGAMFTAAGFLDAWVARLVRDVALPLGGVFLVAAGLVALGEGWRGMLFLVLAVAYLVVAERTGLRVSLVVGALLGAVGVLAWLPTLGGLFDWRLAGGSGRLGPTDVATSVLVLAVAIAAARAFRGSFPRRRVGIHWATWASALVSATVAVVLTGTLLGRAAGQPTAGFQVAHALVTVTWMGLCVFLLARALRRDEQATGSLWLAIALAAAAVAKLFLFDLGTLPGLARALAFLAVGVLLLIVGTWYNRQLERVRRSTPDAEPAPLPTPRVLFVGATDPGRPHEAEALLRALVGDAADIRTIGDVDEGLLFHADRVIVLGGVPIEPLPGMRATIEHWDVRAGDLDARVQGLARELVPVASG